MTTLPLSYLVGTAFHLDLVGLACLGSIGFSCLCHHHPWLATHPLAPYLDSQRTHYSTMVCSPTLVFDG